ncbi:DUF4354 family protein [Escherichia coli]|uniref:DUF4354 family protein n=1 Tax=Escherichia coli TaxID=562 RepID=UPI00044E12EC|nr:DUF4354 family protein [Escherichia coli]EEZ5888442.1 DUF4354 family protein [Escherichia coli O146]EKF4762548.1 DUF4354 family protein [Escherichia coli O113]EKK2708199.1 DUF4354 family protein [Escherichia coli O121]EEQ9430221.1 DUF4354 family protein [Escherichia coli]EEU2850711.1 DUF4354 family protein [Escherichia coli]
MKSKRNTLLALLVLPFISLTAHAISAENIVVYAVEKSRGSVSVADQHIYTKSFNVILKNLSAKDINLSNYCIKGISPDGREFIMNSVKDDILKNTLPAHKTTQGTFSLHGNSISVQKVVLVKLSDDCTNNQNDKLPFPLENGYID